MTVPLVPCVQLHAKKRDLIDLIFQIPGNSFKACFCCQHISILEKGGVIEQVKWNKDDSLNPLSVILIREWVSILNFDDLRFGYISKNSMSCFG